MKDFINIKKVIDWIRETRPVKLWVSMFGVFAVPVFLYFWILVANLFQSEFSAAIAWGCAIAICILANAHTKIMTSFSNL